LGALDNAAVDGIDAGEFATNSSPEADTGRGSKMKPISGKQTLWIFSFLGVLLSTIAPANCRQWAHNPTDLASDYLTINDNRGSGEIVLIMWLAAPRFAKGPTQDMLNKYVVIGVAHAHTAKDGTMSFDRTTTLDAANAEGNKLTLLDAGTMPPTVVGRITVITVRARVAPSAIPASRRLEGTRASTSSWLLLAGRRPSSVSLLPMSPTSSRLCWVSKT